MKRQASLILSLLAICILGFLSYANSFQSTFHFDDFIYIVNNPSIVDITDLKAIYRASSYPSRLITFFTFALNYHFNQWNVFGYHVVNVCIHIMNACLVWWLVRLLLSTPKLINEKVSEKKNLIALFSALLFVAHPMQIQAVTYVCQRFASLATVFYVLTACLYLKGRQDKNKVFIVGSVISAILGMFTKEIVLSLPIIILLIEIFFFQEKIEFKKYLNKKNLLFVLTLLLFLLMVPMIYMFQIESVLSPEMESWSYRGEQVTSMNYFLTQFRVIPMYLKLMILPIGQNLLYDMKLSNSLFEFRTLFGALFLLSILFIALKKRKKNLLVSFGIFWFFICLSVESSFIPIRHVIFEHRTYLPSVGLAIAGSLFLFQIFKNEKKFIVSMLVIVLCLSYLTYQRNKVWANDITLWSDVIEKSPNKVRGYTHLATAYMNRGQYNKALVEFNRAITVRPENGESYNNRGNAYYQLGRVELALEDYQKALELDSTLERAHNNLGVLLGKRKEFELALNHYNQALELNPRNSGTYYNRANIYLQTQKLNLAFTDYTKAIELNPRHARAFYYRSQIYMVRGEKSRALEDALKAREYGYNIKQDYLNQLLP